MRRTALSAAFPAVLVVTALAASACGSSSASDSAAGGPVTVTASDTGCGLSRTTLSAGSNTFAITNKGARTTEVYVYADGDRIVAEKENIGPGLQYDLAVDVPAGSYEVACKPGQTGDGIRTKITVSGAAGAVDPATAQAVGGYRAYVQQQADALVPLVAGLAAAVKAGDVAGAKALYAPSRVPWERIEPVAEAFGDLDPELDLREADLSPGEDWTGWHRIEKALWADSSTEGMTPVADGLVAHVAELQSRIATAPLTATSIGNGARELLDEVATGKITGEEEAWSHTDLADFAANVEGAQQAFTALRPLVGDPALPGRLDAAFASVRAALAPYAQGSGYVSYETVDDAGRRELARVVDALGEPLSQLSAAAQ